MSRAEDVTRAVTELTEAKGFPPSVRELAQHMGVGISTVHDFLSRAKAKGLITQERGSARTIRVVSGD